MTVSEIGKHSDYVVIDGAPRVTELSRSAIMASDLIIIPVQPSPYDIWASSDIIKLIREAQIYKPGIMAAMLISRRIANTSIGRDVIQVLSGFELPVFEAKLSQRVIFAESASAGLSVFEQDPRSPAADEMRAVGAEVLRCLKGERQ
jgi:chromosome partitioning protein